MGMGMGYGRGGMGMGYGMGDPNVPPPQPPAAWQRFLHAMGNVMGFFGRIAMLVDENTQAVHFFISALLQMVDRAGSLYSELVRFILRVLGFKTVPPKGSPGSPAVGGPSPLSSMGNQGGYHNSFQAAWHR